MAVGSRSRTIVLGTGRIEIGSNVISCQPKVKNLGVVLDSSLPICDYISSVCHSDYLELHSVRSARPLLTVSAPKHIKGSKERYLLGQKHTLKMFRLIASGKNKNKKNANFHANRIPFIKLQKDT